MIKNLLMTGILVMFNLFISSAQVYSLLGTGCNEKVYAIAPDPGNSNGVYAGGAFVNAGGGTVNYISRWNGTSWVPLNNGTNFYVRSILAQSANQIYVGGAFNIVGSPAVVAWGVAAWNGTAWSPLGNGVRGDVYALADYNAELYAGGAFDTINGFNPGRGILKWNGAAWSTLGSFTGAGVAGPPGFKVKAMQVFNGELYVGGSFVSANGTVVNNIAKWNGSAWSAIGSGTNGEVNAFSVHNGDLYVGGAFTTANGVTVNGLAKISGNTFTSVGGGVNGTVNGITGAGPFLYVTGAFLTAGTANAQNIARWDGTTWSNVGLGLNFDGYCLTTHTSDMYIGGFFSVAGTVFANNVCKYSNPALAIENPEAALPFVISPNPAHDHILITTEVLPKGCRYQITDVTGRRLLTGLIEEPEVLRIELGSFQRGVYLLTIETESVSVTQKIVLQ